MGTFLSIARATCGYVINTSYELFIELSLVHIILDLRQQLRHGLIFLFRCCGHSFPAVGLLHLLAPLDETVVLRESLISPGGRWFLVGLRPVLRVFLFHFKLFVTEYLSHTRVDQQTSGLVKESDTQTYR